MCWASKNIVTLCSLDWTWGWGIQWKRKNRKKKKTVLFSFAYKRQVILKNQLKRKPKFLLKIYSQKQISIMAWCIKNRKKVFLSGRQEFPWVSCHRGSHGSRITVSSCFRGFEIFFRGYFVDPKYFLMGIFWVQNCMAFNKLQKAKTSLRLKNFKWEF